eukprot:529378_1
MQIADDKYTPDFEDFINVQLCSCGFEEKLFEANMADYGVWKLQISSIGSRPHKRGWSILTEQNVDLIVFRFALTEYTMSIPTTKMTKLIIRGRKNGYNIYNL